MASEMKYEVGQKLWYVPNRTSAHLQPRETIVKSIGRKWVECGLVRFDKNTGAVDGGTLYSSPGRVYASREEYERIVIVEAAWAAFVKSLSVWRVPPGVTVEKIEQAKALLSGEDKS